MWYRAYVQDYGWLGWASDGARAGTTGIGYRVEALQVRVLAKGSAAPGPTDGAYRDVADEKVIGVPRIRLVTWLTQHQYDGYYLGTPYSTGILYSYLHLSQRGETLGWIFWYELHWLCRSCVVEVRR